MRTFFRTFFLKTTREQRHLLAIIFCLIIPIGVLFQNAVVSSPSVPYDISSIIAEVTGKIGSNLKLDLISQPIENGRLLGSIYLNLIDSSGNPTIVAQMENFVYNPKIKQLGIGYAESILQESGAQKLINLALIATYNPDSIVTDFAGTNASIYYKNIQAGMSPFEAATKTSAGSLRINTGFDNLDWDADTKTLTATRSIPATDLQLAGYNNLSSMVAKGLAVSLDSLRNPLGDPPGTVSGNYVPNSDTTPFSNAKSGKWGDILNKAVANSGSPNSIAAVDLPTIAGGLLAGTQTLSNAGNLAAKLQVAKTDEERSAIYNNAISNSGSGLMWGAIVTIGGRAVITLAGALGVGSSAGAGVTALVVGCSLMQLSDPKFWVGYANYILDPKSVFLAGAQAVSIAFNAIGNVSIAATQFSWWKMTTKDFMDRIKDQITNDKQTDWSALANTDGKTLAGLVNKALDATVWQNNQSSTGNRNINDDQGKNVADFSNDPKNVENIDNNSRVGVPSSNGSANFAAGNAQYISVDGNLPAGFGSVQQGNNSTTFTPSFSLQTPNTVLSVPDGNGGVILFDPSKGSPVAALPNLNSGNIDSPGPLKMDWPPPPVAPPVVTPKLPPSQNIQTNSNSTYTTKINNSDGSLSYQITVQNKSDGSSSVTWQSYSYDKSGKLTSTTVDTTNYKSNGDYTNTNTTNSNRPISLTPTKFPKLDDGKPKETCLSAACRLLNPVPIPNSNKLGAGTKKTIEDSNRNKTGAVTALPKIVYGEEVND